MTYGDQEDGILFPDWEGYSQDMEHWRWCDHLSVAEASMLAAGLNPSVFEPSTPERLSEGHFHRIGSTNHVDNYFHSTSFVPVFQAITRAVLKAEIPCEFAFPARNVPTVTAEDRGFSALLEAGEGSIEYEFLIRSDSPVTSNSEISSSRHRMRLHFVKEADWQRSIIKVDDFKDWMVQRGRRPVFFFPSVEEDFEAFRNPAHEHFSAELDFAVTVWQALLPRRKFAGGIKAEIEKWIAENPTAWKGDEPMSGAAKERLATLVNWNKSGGAPKTGG